MKKILSFVLTAVFLISVISSTVVTEAASFKVRTSYPSSSDPGYKYYSSPLNTFPLSPYNKGNCTWYAYGRAYEVYGKDPGLRKAGNAASWYSFAKKNGMSVGQKPKAGSIICWGGNGYGHVAFVEKVDKNGKITFTESNYQFDKDTPYKKFRTYTTSTPETYLKRLGGKLLGYIYFDSEPQSTPAVEYKVSFETDISRNTYEDDFARVYTSLEKTSGMKVTDAGISIWREGEAESSTPTYTESYKSFSYYADRSTLPINYKIGSGAEVDYRLRPGMKYYYRIFCKVEGETYECSGDFVTPGTLMGDVNRDGKINVKDPTAILRYMTGTESDIDLTAADVNDDKKANVKDAMRIVQYIAEWDVPLGY